VQIVGMLSVRHSRATAKDFLETIEQSRLLRLEWTTPDRFHQGGGLLSQAIGQRLVIHGLPHLCCDTSFAFAKHSLPMGILSRQDSLRSC